MRQGKVNCPDCGKSLGYQGLSIHMRHKHGKKGVLPDMRQVRETVHGVDLETIIHTLVIREGAIQMKLDEANALRDELVSIGQLRSKLEELVDTYKKRKELLTAATE